MTPNSSRRACGIAALAGLLILLPGCAMLTLGTPTQTTTVQSPGYTTETVEDAPLPDVITQGLTDEEIHDVTLYRDTLRGVVNITTQRAASAISRGSTGAIGSGFIIDQTAHVVTNYHVIEGAVRVTITLYDGSSYPGTIVGYDSELDIAVISFDPLGRALTSLSFGDSGTLQVGQKVYAFGSPFGLEGTLTDGIVSGLNRPIPSESGYIIRNLIQTDAAINSGNSGGPLIDSSGEVVGINVLILSPSGGSIGIGFAIPANGARRVIESIVSDGRVERGWIEVSGITVTPRLAAHAGLPSQSGLLVTHVLQGGNADRAGLHDGRGGPQVRYGLTQIPVQGDIIVGVNGEPAQSAVDLLSLLEPTQPGDVITITVVRGNERLDFEIELAERPRG